MKKVLLLLMDMPILLHNYSRNYTTPTSTRSTSIHQLSHRSTAKLQSFHCHEKYVVE